MIIQLIILDNINVMCLFGTLPDSSLAERPIKLECINMCYSYFIHPDLKLVSFAFVLVLLNY